MYSNTKYVWVNDETCIPWSWFRCGSNELCMNCKKATDGRECSWASKAAVVPEGAVAYVCGESTRIIVCPNYHGEKSKRPINEEEFEELKGEVIKMMYTKCKLRGAEHVVSI